MRITLPLLATAFLHGVTTPAAAASFLLAPDSCLHLFEPYSDLIRQAPVNCFERGGVDDRGKEFFAITTKASDKYPSVEARMIVQRVNATIEIYDTRVKVGELGDYVYLVLVTRIVHSGSPCAKVIVKLEPNNADARDAAKRGWTESRLGKTLIKVGFVNVQPLLNGKVEFTRKRGPDSWGRRDFSVNN